MVTIAKPDRFRILITDDDPLMRDGLREIVEAEGFHPVLASDGEEALDIVQAETVHLAFLDMHMPKLTGLETLEMVRRINEWLPAILVTADATMELMRQAFHAKVYSVIPKPVNRHVVITTLFRALVKAYGPDADAKPGPPTGDETR